MGPDQGERYHSWRLPAKRSSARFLSLMSCFWMCLCVCVCVLCVCVCVSVCVCVCVCVVCSVCACLNQNMLEKAVLGIEPGKWRIRSAAHADPDTNVEASRLLKPVLVLF